MSRAERFLTHEKAVVEFFTKPGAVTADLVNLSSSGACLQWHLDENYEIQNGELLRVTIRLPHLKKQHFLTAEVIWSHEDKIGVTFIKPDSVTARKMSRA